MARLFDRRAAVTVDELRILNDPSDSGERIPGLRIAFKVEKSKESKSNKASAQIFGLNEDSRGKMTNTRRPQFIIEAGYRDTMAQIFKGKALEVTTTRQVPGILTTVKAKDGFVAGRHRIVKALPPGATAGEAIEAVAKSMEVSAKKAIDRAKAGDFTGGVKQLFQGLSLSGNSRDEMDKLAETYGFEWSIQDGDLQILNPDETTSQQAILVSSSTGLIGSPVRVIDDKKPRANIQKGRSLLEPGMSIGRRLQLESAEVSGTFRILKLTHAGDTSSGDFFTDWEAQEI